MKKLWKSPILLLSTYWLLLGGFIIYDATAPPKLAIASAISKKKVIPWWMELPISYNIIDLR